MESRFPYADGREAAFSIGRLDQLLWPFYRADLEAGQLSEEEALELLGGMQVQWDLVDNEMLRAAQEHPEDYRDLIVRVAGYSAFFTDLERVVQDDIVARTEQVIRNA